MLSFLLVICGNVFAQQITVQGVVTQYSNGSTLPGVSIRVQDTSQGTITDIDGRYEITTTEDAILVFSYIGMTEEVVAVEGRSNIDVALMEDISMLSEIVVIGYGSVRRSDLTGAVSQVTATDFERVPAINPLVSLQGRASGLSITQNSGAPGAGASIRIRGEQSISGTNSPIFVVDGVITTNIDNLNPQDIESASVLKDASVVAIYGSRAANGVIVIETKRGEENRAPVITFNTYQGIQTRSNLRTELLNADEWLEIYTESYENAGISPNWDEQTLAMYQGVDTDWLDAVTRTGCIANYNLSVAGGSEKSNYYVSANYSDNMGMITGFDYNRFNLRLNSDHQVRDWIRFGNSLNVFSSNQNSAINNYNPYTLALQKVPLTRLYEDDGDWGVIRNTTLEHMHVNALWAAENMHNRRDQKGVLVPYLLNSCFFWQNIQ